MSEPYKVSELARGSESRWDAFVEANGGSFFHLAGWRRIIEEALGHPTTYLLCECNDEIVGVLPLAHVKSWLFGSALISLPFLVYGGPVSNGNEDAERHLEKAAVDRARALDVDYLEFRSKVPSDRDWQVRNTHATFSRPIDPDPEENLLAIPRKQRAMVRKGIKAQLHVELDDNVERLYEALLPCKRNLGTPFFSARYLTAVKEEFMDQAEVMTVVRGNQLVASVMSFRFRNEILPYYGGGGTLARELKANDFMYWSVMEKACKDGVEIFDFGRSLIGSGAYNFKKNWGFEPTPLNYEFSTIRSNKPPDLNPSNPKYQFLINVWKKLPLPVAGMLGPSIARRLG